MSQCIVIGAGIGGLTAAAVLAREGVEVTVLEAQAYPGGCAGTFYHQGYQFDAGATLAAGFYQGGPMDLVAQETGVQKWPARAATAVMSVHLPKDQRITLWSDERRWDERLSAFGTRGLSFWEWQERTANAMWDLALKLPSWPLQSLRDAAQITQIGYSWLAESQHRRLLPGLFVDAFEPVRSRLQDAPDSLRLFVDAQLLISAQATSDKVNSLYGASALDLPRRGVAYVEGGIGTIAHELVKAIRQNRGQVLYHKEATHLIYRSGQPLAVETKPGEIYMADAIIANLTPSNLVQLMNANSLTSDQKTALIPEDGWGAFTMYLGVDGSYIPTDEPSHHQVVAGLPLAEGNSIFISVSPAWDALRAPFGHRAVTISTHTKPHEWWKIYHQDRARYEDRKATYAKKILNIAETALPGIRQAIRLSLVGTPITFQRFTRRAGGWVGGFPQTHLSRAIGARIRSGIWMVGDSIFPGQSITATALGGIRVARQVLNELKYQYYSLPTRTTAILSKRTNDAP
jgi:C-3',4' desaturase CrtD